ncbi:MAG: hypothetical protein ACXW1D_00345 [Halobacteriota archaeon]
MSKEVVCYNCRGSGDMFGGFECDECNGTGIDLDAQVVVELEAEVLRLHKLLAHERLRADLGWMRYESRNRQLIKYEKDMYK